jgi:hypothetical protein
MEAMKRLGADDKIAEAQAKEDGIVRFMGMKIDVLEERDAGVVDERGAPSTSEEIPVRKAPVRKTHTQKLKEARVLAEVRLLFPYITDPYWLSRSFLLLRYHRKGYWHIKSPKSATTLHSLLSGL